MNTRVGRLVEALLVARLHTAGKDMVACDFWIGRLVVLR